MKILRQYFCIHISTPAYIFLRGLIKYSPLPSSYISVSIFPYIFLRGLVKYSPLPPSAHPALAEPRLQTAPPGPPMDHSQPTNPAKWNTCQNLTESFILEPCTH